MLRVRRYYPEVTVHGFWWDHMQAMPTNILQPHVRPFFSTVHRLNIAILFCEALRWRHTERDGVSSHQAHDCLLNRLFGHRWQKTSKLRVTDLCEGNSPVTGEFPAQMASNAKNVSIRWLHHGKRARTQRRMLISANPPPDLHMAANDPPPTGKTQ